MPRDPFFKEMALEGILKTIPENAQILGFFTSFDSKECFSFFTLSIQIK